MEAFDVEASITEGQDALQALLSFVQEQAGQLEAHTTFKANWGEGYKLPSFFHLCR